MQEDSEWKPVYSFSTIPNPGNILKLLWTCEVCTHLFQKFDDHLQRKLLFSHHFWSTWYNSSMGTMRVTGISFRGTPSSLGLLTASWKVVAPASTRILESMLCTIYSHISIFTQVTWHHFRTSQTVRLSSKIRTFLCKLIQLLQLSIEIDINAFLLCIYKR